MDFFYFCRKKHLEPDAAQTSSNKEINSDVHPGAASSSSSSSLVEEEPGHNRNHVVVSSSGPSPLLCVADGAECSVQQMKPGHGVAARLLAVIEDLEQAHATFQRREKEDASGVILNP